MDRHADLFEPLRPVLVRVAYRMLGSVADAEDTAQDAWLRWTAADRSAVREPEAFLRTMVTRLCLDRLKSAQMKRETYIGPWLPDPVFEEDEVEDVTLPLMLALERLSPLERAAFLLHDVFGATFEEVAATLERDPAACRQLASRARDHVREAKPRFAVDKAVDWRWPRPSSRPRAPATWPPSAACWPRTWPAIPTAAASATPPSARCSATPTS
jgi:RNA polymerase sigma-70 factor (ECF subfamily)